jgi:hypothetical protein
LVRPAFITTTSPSSTRDRPCRQDQGRPHTAAACRVSKSACPSWRRGMQEAEKSALVK